MFAKTFPFGMEWESKTQEYILLPVFNQQTGGAVWL